MEDVWTITILLHGFGCSSHEKVEDVSTIIILILINAITLRLETSPKLIEEYEYALHIIDQTILWIFVIEILLKIYVYRFNFFNDGWNIFDFLIVGISLLPSSGILSILGIRWIPYYEYRLKEPRREIHEENAFQRRALFGFVAASVDTKCEIALWSLFNKQMLLNYLMEIPIIFERLKL